MSLKAFTVSVSKFSQEIGQTTLSEFEASVLLKLLSALSKQVQTSIGSAQCQKYIDSTAMAYFDTLEKTVDSSGLDDVPTGLLN